MSGIKRYFELALMMLGLALLANCGGESEPSAQEKIRKILTSGDGTWEPQSSAVSITLDGTDVADDFFDDFTIRFTNDEVFTTGTTPVFSREDTWSFKDKSATILVRGSDEREITIIEISSSELILQMDWDETTYGSRAASLPGTYQFTLNK